MNYRANIKQTTGEKDSLGCLLFCIVLFVPLFAGPPPQKFSEGKGVR